MSRPTTKSKICPSFTGSSLKSSTSSMSGSKCSSLTTRRPMALLNGCERPLKKNHRIRFISFSRNFGHQAAVTAGLQRASGDVLVVMDADLQDPPQVIPDMLQRWREGYQVVRGTRAERESDPWSKRFFAWGYYRILGRLSKVKIPVDSGDFCLLDRLIVDTINSLPERNRYVRGLRAWIGFRQIDQPFKRQRRFGGTPKYSFLQSLASRRRWARVFFDQPAAHGDLSRNDLGRVRLGDGSRWSFIGGSSRTLLSLGRGGLSPAFC